MEGRKEGEEVKSDCARAAAEGETVSVSEGSVSSTREYVIEKDWGLTSSAE